MSIVRGVYEGLTAVIYGFIFDIALKLLLLIGFTDIIYDILQLIIAILWIGMAMFGWGGVCIISKGTCRLSTIYRYVMFIVIPIMAFSYILYLYNNEVAAALLFLIAVSITLGLSVSGYVGAYIISNQFRNNLGRIGVVISIIAVIMWLTLVPRVMEIGTAINAVGNALIVIALMQVRRRYSPNISIRRK
ncbi:MAG: hypothetical protein ACP5GZ_04280 [Vulcanisaeta sp.]|uniref:hypothetical protein n=1 Tax=Vulcanisaeta sp. TaxID=2020871 RepID=UPI003D11A21A